MSEGKEEKTGRWTRRFKGVSLGLLSTVAVSLSGCETQAPSNNVETPGETASPVATTEKKLRVVTTFLPITLFTKAVAGDRAEVTQLLPVNVGPHDYQAKPEDIRPLSKADVLVKNGLEMESFLDSLVKSASNANLKIIDSSQGVKTITTASIEGDNHSHEHETGHEHGEYNPHIWLDPKRVIIQVKNIRDGLIKADPSGKEVYTTNAAAYIEKLKALDAKASERLKSYGGKSFVAYHDFAPYFAQSYNLKADFLVDVPEENPTPGDVKRVMETVKQSNLKTLLAEPQEGAEGFAALAKDLNVRISTFDAMETGDSKALQPDYYIDTMQQNIENLVNAFGKDNQQSFFRRESLPGLLPLDVRIIGKVG